MDFIDRAGRQQTAPVALAPGLWLAAARLQAAEALAPPEALLTAQQAGWNDTRRQSFLAGRAVAASALVALGNPGPVARASDGAPLWPDDVCGSIAHSAHHAVAVVAGAGWAAMGVDVEPDLPLPADAAGLVLTAHDDQALQTAFGSEAAAHCRLVFGAKECVHKALQPQRGVWLEFEEVAIDWHQTDSQNGNWRPRPLSAAAAAAFGNQPLEGEWWRAAGALWTLLKIPR